MKRFSALLLVAVLIVLHFTSCEELGGLIPGPKEFSFVMINPDYTTDKIEDGQNINLEIGDYLSPGVSDGRTWWGVREDNAELSISDPSVLMFYWGMLYAIHGGESSVSIKSGEHASISNNSA